MALDHQELNRLFRSQATGPATRRGGCSRVLAGGETMVEAVMSQRSTSAMRALYQFMNRLMERLMVR